ncbi:MAG: AEC family transporter [Ruminococcaceae bacterium]|nr:AEC family transporter [Oscillospiraceae bacterium]
MDSLIFALGAVAPIVFMVIIGYLLKKLDWMDARFARKANKLVFTAFMPVMLFLNIYRIEDLAGVNWSFILYVVIALLLIFFVSIPFSIMVASKKNRRGVLVQAAFRSGYSLIGIPLAESLYGTEGAIAATLLSAAVIPLFNVLAVVCLSALGSEGGEGVSVKRILLGIVKNPLIIGIVTGLAALGVRTLLERADIAFRLSDIGPLFTILQYLSNLAIPLALLVLGAQFEFSAVAAMKKEIVFGTAVRTVIVPVLTIGIAFLFFRDRFGPAHFACFVAVFATPVAVTTVPMAQEMDGDVTLAGQLVVWSTLVAAISVFLASFLLRLGGVL